jgi:threonine synthase
VVTPDATTWRCECGGAYAMADLRVPPPHALDSVTLGEGNTPVARVVLRDREVLAKLEFESPTGSFKDRGAAVLIAAAVDLGATRAVADSSGNAGVAIAAYATRAGLPCDVFVASSTPGSKLDRIQGAVHLVNGSRGDVAAAAIEHVEATGAFYASHVWNPWFFEGTKHFTLEVLDQLDRVPDALVLPFGNGTLVLGAWRALQERGVRVPIIAVEAQDRASTVAAGIGIASPVRETEVHDIVLATGGSRLSVTDAVIADAVDDLADAGFAVEPTAAVSVAALSAVDGETIVLPISSGARTH